MRVFAPAKVNLTLDIIGRREDGYHLMQMVMQTVSLYDVLEIRREPEEVTFSCDAAHLPTDGKNLAVRAAQAFFSLTQIRGGASINLRKHIPSGAGMGGGSADAAAVLAALDRLYGTDLPLSELMALGETVGADVPFCLHGGTALVEGIGEKVKRLSPLPHCWMTVVKPKLSINTRTAFAAFDQGETGCRPDTVGMLSSIANGDLQGIAQLLYNVFEQTAGLRELCEIKKQLCENGALGAVMTGSGSAVFGLFSYKCQASRCRELLSRPDRKAYLCEPVIHGPLIQAE